MFWFDFVISFTTLPALLYTVPADLLAILSSFAFTLLFNSTTILTIDFAGKDGSKVTTVVATPGQGPDRPQEVSYSDTKVIGNGSFGVVFQAKLCDNGELVAIKKVLQDKRFKVIVTSIKLLRRLSDGFLIK